MVISCTDGVDHRLQLGPVIHGELFQTAFLKCYTQIHDDTAYKVR